MDEPVLELTLAGAGLVVATLLALLSALVERSGPIRLRHWAGQAGPALRDLYHARGRFESFRFLLALLARFFPLVPFLLLGLAGEALGWGAPWLLALLPVVGVLALTEAGSRYLLGHRAEESLRALTFLYRLFLWLLFPLVAALAPALPEPARDEEVELENEASEGEIEAFIDVGRREGILEAEEGDLLRGLVDFGDTQVRSVMTPRVDMVCAAIGTPLEELVDLAVETGHSRIPLFQESVDRIVGILHIRDLMRVLRSGEEESIRPYLKPPHFVPQTKSLAPLLKELQARHQELAIVVDEYGGTEGLVTIEDLLEEIFGEIVDEHDVSEPEQVQLTDGSWRVDGGTHVEELEDLFEVRLDEEMPYETVGGLIFGLLGHVPEVGEEVFAYGLRFLVEATDRRRVQTARVSPVEPESDPSAELAGR